MEIHGSGSQAQVKSSPKPAPSPKPADPPAPSAPAPKGPSEAEVHLSADASAALAHEDKSEPPKPTPSTTPIDVASTSGSATNSSVVESEAASDTSAASDAAESSETKESGPPDFKTMTVDEQYDYLTQVVQSQADDPEAWKTANGEVNLVGIRSFQDGQPVDVQGDVYNDTIYAAWTDEEGQHHVQGFQASTDAGVVSNPEGTGFGYSAGGEYKGLSHLADGFYGDAWVKGGVPGNDTGLRQSADVRINADTNNDGIIEADERLGTDADGDGLNDGLTESAAWGIQFHPGGSRDRQVDTWSAGCQVIVREEYQGFKDILNSATNKTYSYTLVDSSNLPPVGQANAAAPPAANSGSVGSSTANSGTPDGSSTGTANAGAPGSQANQSTPAPQSPPSNQAAPTNSTPPDSQASQSNQQANNQAQNTPQAEGSQPARHGDRPAPRQAVPDDLKQMLQSMAPGMQIPDTIDQLITQLLDALSSASSPARGSWSMARSFMQRDVQLSMLQLVMARAQTMGVALSGDATARLSQLPRP